MDWGSLAQAINGAIFGTADIIQGQINNNRANRQQILNLQTQAMLNEMSAETAYQRQEQNYLKYLSPAAIRQQIEEAGMNPAMMYGQSGAGGNMTQTPQSNGVGLPSAFRAENANLMNLDAAKVFQELQNLKAEEENTQADTEVKKKDLPLKDQMLQNLKQEVQESKQRMAEMQQNIQKKFAETINEYQKNKNLKAEEELTKAKKEYEEAITTLTNIQISYEPEKIETQIKEAKANIAQAYAAAKKFNEEAETENQCRQYIVKQLQYAAEEQAYKTLHLQPAEYQLLQKQIQQIINQNGSMEGIRDAFGGWENKAKYEKTMEILNTVANGMKALASTAGAAALIAK